MSFIAITGASHGLGYEIALVLHSQGHFVFDLDKSEPEKTQAGVWGAECDVTKFESLQNSADYVKKIFKAPIDILINCAGINKIGMLEEFDIEDWDSVVNTNARGIFYACKAFLPQLMETKGTVLNIVSNASHMPMTGSAAYNASKGAAHILTLQLARELTRRHGITVFGISPNKLAGTEMSKSIDEQVCVTRGWTPEQAKAYQLQSLLAGEETDPKQLAEFVAFLLSSKDRHKYLTGCILNYGA